MKKFIIIKADTNDADYVIGRNEITDEQIEIIKPLIEAIKNFQPYTGFTKSGSPWTHYHNYPYGDLVRDDLGEKQAWEYYQDLGFSEQVIDLFNNLIPRSEYGIHTIESIDVLVVQEETKLL